ncbi:hypothetical protein PMIT1320_00958 [Prochlorococcus marinus str. MIT 1320]|nr:hypothetical protein PMIT1320_00958 [Prochlorococcus marinus str. MIT 1320]
MLIMMLIKSYRQTMNYYVISSLYLFMVEMLEQCFRPMTLLLFVIL